MSDQFSRARSHVGAQRGLDRSLDPEMLTVGVLSSIDAASNKAVIAVDGADEVRLPFVPGLYRPDQTVLVLRNPLQAGRPFLVAGPTKADTSRPIGTITAVNASANKATVTIAGASFTVPYIPIVTYSVGDDVYVLREPRLGGQPTLILGPCDVNPADVSVDEPASKPTSGSSSGTETAKAIVTPTFTGTYSHEDSAWDRWNVGRYGGRSTLYQGSSFGSGPLTGFAGYDKRVLNLGATAISKIEVRLRGADLALPSYPSITVKGSEHGTRPSGGPSTVGATVTASPGRSGALWVELPSTVVDAFEDGSVRGLVLTGSGYNAVLGTGAGDGMALRVTYTRQA